MLVLTVPAHFDLQSPASGADFSAPFNYNSSIDPKIFGTALPEMPPFTKYGCPHLFVFLRGRMLDGKVIECLIYFNDLQDS